MSIYIIPFISILVKYKGHYPNAIITILENEGYMESLYSKFMGIKLNLTISS